MLNGKYVSNEITVLDIEMFYTHEINQRGVSGNTVLHYHANILKALSDAAKLKLIPYNPAAEVERPEKRQLCCQLLFSG